MATLLKWLGIVLALIALALGLFFFSMRFHDGPIEIITGGPFKTGEPATAPDNWGFLADRDTLEFQTMKPARSRTVWLAVQDDRLFLISGYMTTGYGRLWKQWPHHVVEDDRVILRIDGKLYEQRVERITEGDLIAPVMAEFGRKYGFEGSPEAVASGYAWLYEVKARG